MQFRDDEDEDGVYASSLIDDVSDAADDAIDFVTDDEGEAPSSLEDESGGSRWPFSLSKIPIEKMQSPFLNIGYLHSLLQESVQQLDGLAKFPGGMPTVIRQGISNARTYAMYGLGSIEKALTVGAAPTVNVSDVNGLLQVVDAFTASVKTLAPHVAAYAREHAGQNGLGSFDPVHSRALRLAAQPFTTGDYVGAAASTAGLWGLSRAATAFADDDFLTDAALNLIDKAESVMPSPPVTGGGMYNLPPDIGAGLQTAASKPDSPTAGGGSSGGNGGMYNMPADVHTAIQTAATQMSGGSAWSTIAFLGVVLGGGYLLFAPSKTRKTRKTSRRPVRRRRR